MKVIKGALLALLVAGCNSISDPVKYAEDVENGMKKEVNVGEVRYVIQYKPAGYIVAMEHLDKEAAEQRTKQLEGMVWFNVRLSINGFNQSPLRYKINSLEEYNARQDYYLNQAPKDMYLMYGADTLYTDSYWFENNQNITPYETMIVGFKLPDGEKSLKKDLKFSYYDRVFKNGIIKTAFRRSDIN